MRRVHRVTLTFALAGILVSGSAAPATPAEVPALPVVRPVPGPVSEAFNASSAQQRPFDLAASGYEEREFLVSGQARIYDWQGSGRELVVLAEGPYTTRILVRRPVDPSRSSGTVIVEPFNQSTGVDLPIMWMQSHRQFIADGHAWVGVTTKPNTVRALHRFDAQRYRDVRLARPAGAPACDEVQINPLSGPTSQAEETGLAWDLLAQLGTLLKDPSAAALLGRPAERLYLTGQSQSAGYARTFATAIAPRVRSKGDGPVYDGYLYSGSPPWQVPLHQCRADLDAGDPRLLTPAVGVPVIELFAEGDIGTNLATRRPDSDAAADRFRRYELAGAAHVDTYEQRGTPGSASLQRALGSPALAGEPEDCAPDIGSKSDFPARMHFNAAWRNLEAWVRAGTAPPRGDPLRLRVDGGAFDPATAFEKDAAGNAIGGVRHPHVDVPVARWVGAKVGSFSCMFHGYRLPLGQAELARRYPDRAAYVDQVRRRADQLVAQRWLTPEDRDELVAQAETEPLR
jgi:hypothetical protein